MGQTLPGSKLWEVRYFDEFCRDFPDFKTEIGADFRPEFIRSDSIPSKFPLGLLLLSRETEKRDGQAGELSNCFLLHLIDVNVYDLSYVRFSDRWCAYYILPFKWYCSDCQHASNVENKYLLHVLTDG